MPVSAARDALTPRLAPAGAATSGSVLCDAASPVLSSSPDKPSKWFETDAEDPDNLDGIRSPNAIDSKPKNSALPQPGRRHRAPYGRPLPRWPPCKTLAPIGSAGRRGLFDEYRDPATHGDSQEEGEAIQLSQP
ncbi:hypothetical protein GW17_00018434 [Ensete ventricosum]|nr:hypothetical protein GW17_00018434 [Ensete ventricosum]